MTAPERPQTDGGRKLTVVQYGTTAPDGPARHGSTGEFDSLNSALEEVPGTWIPALLKTVVRRAVEGRVFTPYREQDALVEFVRAVVKSAGS